MVEFVPLPVPFLDLVFICAQHKVIQILCLSSVVTIELCHVVHGAKVWTVPLFSLFFMFFASLAVALPIVLGRLLETRP